MSLYWWGPDCRWKGQFWEFSGLLKSTGTVYSLESSKQDHSIVNCLYVRWQACMQEHIQKSNFHIMKTTAPIASKFCLTIKNNMYCWWVVPIHIQQMQDGDKLQHLHNAFIDVNEICHGNSYWGCILAPPGDYDWTFHVCCYPVFVELCSPFVTIVLRCVLAL